MGLVAQRPQEVQTFYEVIRLTGLAWTDSIVAFTGVFVLITMFFTTLTMVRVITITKRNIRFKGEIAKIIKANCWFILGTIVLPVFFRFFYLPPTSPARIMGSKRF